MPKGEKRYIWWALGAVLTLCAVGGDWDLPLATWIAPIFLLRFARTSRASIDLPMVALVLIAAPLFWMWQTAIPVVLTGVIGCVVFGMVFTLPYVLDRLVTPRLGTIGRLLLFPCAITACELIMGVFNPLGTAYGLRAVTQRSDLPLLQMLALTGPYGIGFMVGLVATTVNFIWRGGLAERRGKIIVGVAAAAVLGVVVSGESYLAFFPVSPGVATVRVAGITPSADALAEQKRRAGSLHNMRALASANPVSLRAGFEVVNAELFTNTQHAADAGAKIVVWSENAGATLAVDRPAFLARAATVARRNSLYLLVANNVFLPTAPYGRDETNLFDPAGKLVWTYEKAHPIPGLETYAPGSRKAPVVQTPYGRLANVICYDADFPAMMRADADIMLMPGGDWPEMGHVHTQMASLRAIENGYGLFRVDLNGWSAAYDRQGHLLAAQDTTGTGQHILFADIPTKGSATIYRRVGDVFAWFCLAVTLALAALGLTSRRQCKTEHQAALPQH